jgi:hypothetical protein
MHAQESFRGIFGSDVNVSNADHGSVVGCDVRVDGFKRPVSDIGESRIGGAKQFHKVTLYMTDYGMS